MRGKGDELQYIVHSAYYRGHMSKRTGQKGVWSSRGSLHVGKGSYLYPLSRLVQEALCPMLSSRLFEYRAVVRCAVSDELGLDLTHNPMD